MHEIVTGPTGTNSIEFGDRERTYELLESPVSGMRAAFECRVALDPNSTFAEFQVDIAPWMNERDVFAAGIRHLEAAMLYDDSMSIKARYHLVKQLRVIGEEFGVPEPKNYSVAMNALVQAVRKMEK